MRGNCRKLCGFVGYENGRAPITFRAWAEPTVHSHLTRDEMSRQKSRSRPSVAAPSPMDEARNELFQHIMSCGVIDSQPEHQVEWFNETMNYLSERYHELSKQQIADLRVLGERFAAPPVKKSASSDAVSAA